MSYVQMLGIHWNHVSGSLSHTHKFAPKQIQKPNGGEYDILELF
nr:hypothetical protein Iba_chr05cCG15520 [Ipomoea batatas]GMD41162.1 hypothetical protein Iba_chr10aCG16390 [Ipomoea batatas]